jgi:alpha-tubulin suppressor-like RCC1 family protein
LNASGDLGAAADAGSVQPSPLSVSGVSNVTNISTGYGSTCATTTEHDLWCFGAAFASDGSTQVYAPTQIVVSVVFWQVAVGGAHVCALGNIGAVFCWGDDSLGQLGAGAPSAATCKGTPCELLPVSIDSVCP